MLRLRVLAPATRPLCRTNASLAPAAGVPVNPPPPAPSASAKATKETAASGSTPSKKAADKKAADKTADTKQDGDADTSESTRPHIRPRRFPAKRPAIDMKRPREWNRPLAPGVLPAYDEALRFIRGDSRALKTELAEVNARIEKGAEGEELEKLKEKAHVLEVQSEINLPDVRWKFRNKMSEYSPPQSGRGLGRLSDAQSTCPNRCTVTLQNKSGEPKVV